MRYDTVQCSITNNEFFAHGVLSCYTLTTKAFVNPEWAKAEFNDQKSKRIPSKTTT